MTGQPFSPSISSLLDIHLGHDSNAGWYRGPGIPPKKLKNAIKTYGGEISQETVLALGDGTVFGSAKEGILITESTLVSGTSEGAFSVQLKNIVSAKTTGGWPEYRIELQCEDGSTHLISTTCFDRKIDALVAFLDSFAANEVEPVPNKDSSAEEQSKPVVLSAPTVVDTSIRAVNASLKLIEVCPDDGFDDVGTLFDSAFQADTEMPLLKGYCRYVGFNGREVDGVFLITNRRILLFSMEMGAKIVFVELTRRLLDKLPVPFLDSIVCFFLFSIPRSIYVALRGGKGKLIAQALDVEEHRLLSDQPPLRKIEDFDFAKLTETVAQVDIGTGVSTGFLSRSFGVSFAPVKIAKAFSVPKDLILPEYETLKPFQHLLNSVRSTLVRIGLDYRLDAEDQKLSIAPCETKNKIAA